MQISFVINDICKDDIFRSPARITLSPNSICKANLQRISYTIVFHDCLISEENSYSYLNLVTRMKLVKLF